MTTKEAVLDILESVTGSDEVKRKRNNRSFW